MAKLGKVIIKVVNEEHDRAEWTHISYIDDDLYKRFMKAKTLETTDLNDIISRWAKEDFNIHLAMSSKNDIKVLKELVKDFYRRAHPELYIESNTDRQGWFRVWLTRKMKEELNIYGEECF
nr:MAG TPA: hypothetical protein [Caudoviricetes sp.]